ncbi:hypothetical protein [Nonomuraea dietziae]|uniref:hypothetical protein n=1 Tax=Nonomuraea dietziae TaxID=65515 RepID=UPI0033E6805D
MVAQTLAGLGGIGKSELVLHYAEVHRGDYDLIWWIDAETPEQIRASLAALGREVSVGEARLKHPGPGPSAITAASAAVAAGQLRDDDALAYALAHLAAPDRAGRWLLIFDNVEDPHHLDPYLGRLEAGDSRAEGRFECVGSGSRKS